MGRSYDPASEVADAAREWIVRLASGDMTGLELCEFQRWVSVGLNGHIFRLELGNWQELETVRHLFPPGLSGSNFPPQPG